MTRLLPLVLALLMTGCASTVYKAATDERSLGDQATDSRICSSIRSSLIAKDSGSLSVLDVFCHDQLVLVGVVDDKAKADKIIAHARSVEGVKSVKSFIQVKQ